MNVHGQVKQIQVTPNYHDPRQWQFHEVLLAIKQKMPWIKTFFQIWCKHLMGRLRQHGEVYAQVLKIPDGILHISADGSYEYVNTSQICLTNQLQIIQARYRGGQWVDIILKINCIWALNLQYPCLSTNTEILVR